MKLFKAAIIAALVALSAPAQAALTYEFQQTISSPSPFVLTMRFTIENELGVQASYGNRGTGNPAPVGVTGNLDNLIELETNVAGLTLDRLHRLQTCVPGGDGICAFGGFALNLTPDYVAMYFYDGYYDTFFGVGDYNPQEGYVSYSSESFETGDNCRKPSGGQATCIIEGEFVLVNVPEPASLALFAVGLIGVMALRRRQHPYDTLLEA